MGCVLLHYFKHWVLHHGNIEIALAYIQHEKKMKASSLYSFLCIVFCQLTTIIEQHTKFWIHELRPCFCFCFVLCFSVKRQASRVWLPKDVMTLVFKITWKVFDQWGPTHSHAFVFPTLHTGSDRKDGGRQLIAFWLTTIPYCLWTSKLLGKDAWPFSLASAPAVAN